MDVTVLMPVRDGARWLGPTLSSLHRLQGEAEILVVDDGSVDETPALLAAAARRDPRFRVLRRPARGIVAALNEGLDAARGRYIARCDADDLVHPRRLVLQLAAAREQGWDVVGSGIRCFPTQRIGPGLRRYAGWQNGLRTHAEMALGRFIESPLVHPSVLFDAALIRAEGGYRDCGWPEDYDLWLRLFAAGHRFGKVPQVLTAWRDHDRRLTRTAATCHEDAVRACKACHLAAGPLSGGRPAFIAGAGREGKRLARALRARGVIVLGFFDVDPRRVGQSIAGLPVRRFEGARLGPDAVVLGAVGAEGARDPLRALLSGAGLVEGESFWCVA